MSSGHVKTMAVFGPDGLYLSHCTWKRALVLMQTGRAKRVNATTIRLKETKMMRKEKMNTIIANEHRICYICGETIPIDDIATIDHVVPKGKNPYADVYENMRCCCQRCNGDKRNMMPTEYINHIINHRDNYDYLSDDRIAYLKDFFTQYEAKFKFNESKRKVSEIDD